MDMSIYLTAPLQMDKICRACLSEKGDMRSLYGACLDEMLLSFASIQIRQGDNLPQLMCVQCVLQCSRAYTFKQQCEKSDNILRQYMSPQFQKLLNQQVVDQTKAELQEQLQFSNTVEQVMVADIPEFIKGERVGPVSLLEVNDEDGQVAQLIQSEIDIVKEETVIHTDQQDEVAIPEFTTGEYVAPISLLEVKNEDGEVAQFIKSEVDVFKEETLIHTDRQEEIDIPEFITGEYVEPVSLLEVNDEDGQVAQFIQSEMDIIKEETVIHTDQQEEVGIPEFTTGEYVGPISLLEVKDEGGQAAEFIKSEVDVFKEETVIYTDQQEKVVQVQNESQAAPSNNSLKYQCTKCSESFALKVDFKVHMATHPKDSDHVCRVCSKPFPEARVLKRHLKIHMEKKPHKCDQCDKTFAESSNLSKHKKTHTGELRNINGKPHLCLVCGRAFKWTSSLSKHMKHHTGHKLFACKYCNKQYGEATNLRIHIRSHTGERPHVCSICNKTFTQLCNLKKHIRVHTGEKPYLCPICGKGFTQSGYVSIHMRIHTGERPYICSTCGKAFAGSNTLAIHQRTHTGEKPYTCTICDKSFGRHQTLLIHTRSHTGHKPHVCGMCNKAFASSGHLSVHMRTHTGEKPYGCTVCGKRFAGSSNLKTHMRGHLGEKPFVCKLCNKSFSQRTNLQQHIHTHTVIAKSKMPKLETVQVPEFAFTQSGYVGIHMRIHAGDRSYVCSTCGKAFATSNALAIHRRTHTGEKPYTCTICKKSFGMNERSHTGHKSHVCGGEAPHTGEKPLCVGLLPWCCNVCGKRFGGLGSLKTHLRGHLGEKPFVCKLCNKSFWQQNNLQQHMRTHALIAKPKMPKVETIQVAKLCG